MIQQFHFWLYIQKEWKQNSTSYLFTCLYCSIIHNSEKIEIAQMSINAWMDKQNVVYIHRVECHSALKRKEIVIHATTWMNIMQSEISQSQKDTYYVIPLIWDSYS